MKKVLICLFLALVATSKRVHNLRPSHQGDVDDKWVAESSPNKETQDLINQHTASLDKLLGTKGKWTITNEWTNTLPGIGAGKHIWISNGAHTATAGAFRFEGADHWSLLGAQEGQVNPGDDNLEDLDD